MDTTNFPSTLLNLARSAAPGLANVRGDPRTANLREAGLTSIAAVRLMLEIEAAFNIAIPDTDLTPQNFANVANIEAMVDRLKALAAA